MNRITFMYWATLLMAAPLFLLPAINLFAHEKPTSVQPKALATVVNIDESLLEVKQVVDKLRTAIATGNTALAEEAMFERVSIFEQGHAELFRAEYLDHHFKQDVIFAKAVSSVVTSSQTKVEGTLALGTAHTTTDGTYKGTTIKNAGVETYVLQLQTGCWRVEHAHWSSRKRQ